MSSAKENSPTAAFPVGDNNYFNPEFGLTKREYFAGLAMQGLCTGATGIIRGFEDPTPYAKGPCDAGVSSRAVYLADALLEALAEQGGGDDE